MATHACLLFNLNCTIVLCPDYAIPRQGSWSTRHADHLRKLVSPCLMLLMSWPVLYCFVCFWLASVACVPWLTKYTPWSALFDHVLPVPLCCSCHAVSFHVLFFFQYKFVGLFCVVSVCGESFIPYITDLCHSFVGGGLFIIGCPLYHWHQCWHTVPIHAYWCRCWFQQLATPLQPVRH